MSHFEQALNANFDKLEQYVPVVARVHGPSHPVFYEVRDVYNVMADKLKVDANVNLADEFKQLRNITNNYEVPSDVCETYEAVYNMLKQLDEATGK